MTEEGLGEGGTGRGGRTLRFLADQPVTVLTSVRPKKAEALAEWGVESILDLLTTYPRRYIDRTRQVDIAELSTVEQGDEVVVLAEVRRTNLVGGYGGRRGGGRSRARVELDVHDASGGVKIVFFNQPWRAKQLVPGTEALFSGKPSDFRGTRQLVNPVVDVLVLGTSPETSDLDDASMRRTLRIIPVYPQSAKSGLNSVEIGAWIAESLRRAGEFADPLPETWRQSLGLITRTAAIRQIHLPETVDEHPPARRRLSFDELFRLQLALVLRRRALELDARAIRHEVSVLDVTTPTASRSGSMSLVRRFLEQLPFELTQAQRRALASIVAELAGPLPMHRLLQGDVGSGKTVVAIAALLASVQGGHQGALMVPTEVLAEQHAMAVRELIGDLAVVDESRLEGTRPVEVGLLTNRTSGSDRVKLHEGLRGGTVDILVGTQALLTDEVRFHSLGVVVIDEQHRFGVEQRAALREKGRSSIAASGGADPDLLVMTATPIPRTAAMVLFGDLDMVVLDELPPGRLPITTVWAETRMQETEAWNRIRSEVEEGHRAFVVCPLVEESDRLVAASAIEEFDRLESGELKGYQLGLLHGQMPSREKESIMSAFRSGEIQILVATTVIEVGVDIPQATVMVVKNAERFGIAQLHQLRGRVGRGGTPSWCYLLSSAAEGDAIERLAALVRTTDGFELAEVDLDIRGEGTILGSRQKGQSDLKLARLREDGDLLDAARKVAEDVTAADALLDDHPLIRDEVRLFLDPAEEAFLFKS